MRIEGSGDAITVIKVGLSAEVRQNCLAQNFQPMLIGCSQGIVEATLQVAVYSVFASVDEVAEAIKGKKEAIQAQ